MGSYAKALAHFEEYDRLHEQINIQESLNEVSELLTRFETEAKEQEITMLEQANRLQKQTIRGQRLLIALLLLGGLLIALLFWWWAHNKNQALKRMQTELHHFILSREKENGSLESSQAYEKWGLTERESEIIYYLGQGCSNAHIADKLHISLNTVKFHIKNIYLKLDVKNRIQALLRCSEINDH
jgi:ATP/maltotriose-dependent transcriptional regulator MalT